jgi:hypothetical protein
MHRLVGQHRRQLRLGIEVYEHPFGNKNMPARQGKRVDSIIVQCRVVVFPIRSVADARDFLADAVDIVLKGLVFDLAAHLLFNLGSILTAQLKVLILRNKHQFLPARYGISLAADTQAQGNA